MKTFEVIVTWMDGQQETYQAGNYWVREGELILQEDGSYARQDDRRYIPLHNVRVWKAERAR